MYDITLSGLLFLRYLKPLILIYKVPVSLVSSPDLNGNGLTYTIPFSELKRLGTQRQMFYPHG